MTPSRIIFYFCLYILLLISPCSFKNVLPNKFLRDLVFGLDLFSFVFITEDIKSQFFPLLFISWLEETAFNSLSLSSYPVISLAFFPETLVFPATWTSRKLLIILHLEAWLPIPSRGFQVQFCFSNLQFFFVNFAFFYEREDLWS